MPTTAGHKSTLTFNELISGGRTYLMGCAMISIMLFHEYFIPQYPITHFFRLYGHWGVELFLLLSGFGIVHSLQKNSLKQYYINRAKRLVPTCILAGLCKLLLDRLGFIEIKTQNVLMLVTNLYLWFIYAIVVYYTIAPLIYHFLKRYSVATLCVICVLSVLCGLIPFEAHDDYLISKLGWINARLPIFVFGMFIAVKPLKYSVRSIFLVGLPFLLLSMALIILRKLGYYWSLHFEYILLLPASLAMCILGHLFYRLLSWIKCAPVLNFFGKYSLELYLWHEFIYWNIDEHIFFKDLSMPIKFILGVAVSLLFAYLTRQAIDYLMKRSPLSR